MKNCRYIIHTLLAFIFCMACATGAVAQGNNNGVDVKAEIRELTATADSLTFDIDINVSNLKQSSSHELILIPVIHNNKSSRELPAVVLTGKRRIKLNRRAIALNQQVRVSELYERQVTSGSKTDYATDYQITLPYERWMLGASISLLIDDCGCGDAKSMSNRMLLSSIPAPNYDFKPELAFIEPPREEIKLRAESSSAYVTFETGKAKLLPNFGNNSLELDKIRASVEYIKGESTAQIGGVSIIAYASPEGSESFNHELSRLRAASLREYVRTVYDFPSNIMSSEGQGEDWATLSKMISENSSLESREQIMHIIATEHSLDRREAQIKAVAGGRPYRYLLDTYYPKLRRSDYKISYTVPSFSVEKGKEVFKTHPGMLSLEEMYHIAGTYEKGSDKFKEVFDVAVRVFPNDRIANINAATAALMNKDKNHALQYLRGLENDKDAWNSLGVLHAMMEEYDKAEEYLNKAINAGSKEAGKNLVQVKELARLQRFFAQ